MPDLIAFLCARLDEEEAAAREAADGDSGQWFMGRKWNVYRAGDENPYGEEENRLVAYGNVKPQSEHIARHDPARVLREVEAGRRILARHTMCVQGLHAGPYPCPELADLLYRWADHPDYRPEWAP